VSDRPRTLYLLLEGQTEETIVRDVFMAHLEALGWCVRFSIVKTSRSATSRARRGGVSSWAKLETEIKLVLNDPGIDVLSTLIDYYAFPSDAPGMAGRLMCASPIQRVANVEAALASYIGDSRFVPHLVLHEVEAWVYVAAAQLAELKGDRSLTVKLRKEMEASGGPEGIDEGPDTAPSKRLMRHWPEFSKTIDGPLAIAAVGLPEIRRQCPHVDAWLRKLENLR
jgi:Domain of unknown function (DUF4276)